MALVAKKTLGQILKDKGKITEEQLKDAMQVQQQTTQMLGQVLVDLDFCKEQDVLQAHAEQLGVPYVDLEVAKPDSSVAATIPPDLMEKYQAVPLRLDGRRLTVAMVDPKNVFAIDDLRMRTKYDIRAVLASASQIAAVRGKLSTTAAATPASHAAVTAGTSESFSGGGMEASLKGAFDAIGGGRSLEDQLTVGAGSDEDITASAEVEKLKDMVEEAPIIRIVNAILQAAIKEGASDIHVEPQRKGVRIRYRIDGVLHETMKIPSYVHAPLISRIKIMGDMNIAERRLCQDGRIHIRHQKKDYDMRVSSIPTTHGEKVVMRILDTSSVLLGLDKLGILGETRTVIELLCNQPNGMVLSCGPTGSGKTTTQYSIMNVINSVEKNIITIEDPVEYQLPGLNQVHVNRKAGLTFSNALRSFLRQDPDIIMVGEIRDLETAEIAVQAALTGHLVLSTLHTNDAPSSVTRLIDMGVEPFLISASIIGAMAQRLARKVCLNCKEPDEPPLEALARLGYDPDVHTEATFFKGKGCEVCRQTGYKGRIGIYELFTVNTEIADLILRRSPHSELKEAAMANGMKTLQMDGLAKIMMGLTTVEEVSRVVQTIGEF